MKRNTVMITGREQTALADGVRSARAISSITTFFRNHGRCPLRVVTLKYGRNSTMRYTRMVAMKFSLNFPTYVALYRYLDTEAWFAPHRPSRFIATVHFSPMLGHALLGYRVIEISDLLKRYRIIPNRNPLTKVMCMQNVRGTGNGKVIIGNPQHQHGSASCIVDSVTPMYTDENILMGRMVMSFSRSIYTMFPMNDPCSPPL